MLTDIEDTINSKHSPKELHVYLGIFSRLLTVFSGRFSVFIWKTNFSDSLQIRNLAKARFLETDFSLRNIFARRGRRTCACGPLLTRIFYDIMGDKIENLDLHSVDEHQYQTVICDVNIQIDMAITLLNCDNKRDFRF